ncbi:MAG: hypothetical protein ACXAD7_03035 [Candidatus Kariarchaeaceae archaeon]
MNIENHRIHQRKINTLYDEENYQELIEYVDEVAVQYPDLKAPIYYFQMCAAVKLDNYDLAMNIFKEIIEEGGWYSEMILRQSPSLKPLQGKPDFEKLVEISTNRSVEASKKDYSFTIFPDSVEPPYPFMLVIHADGGDITGEFEAWKSFVDQGYVIGMPRSSQVFWSGEECAYWPDIETASNQIKNYVDAIDRKNSLNFDQCITGGLSSGGTLAIRSVLTGLIPAKGFIVVAPGGQWTNEPEIWQPLIEGAKGRELQGTIILGQEDKVIHRESITTLVKMLNDGGIPCKFIEIPGLGHIYPQNFGELAAAFLEDLFF